MSQLLDFFFENHKDLFFFLALVASTIGIIVILSNKNLIPETRETFRQTQDNRHKKIKMLVVAILAVIIIIVLFVVKIDYRDYLNEQEASSASVITATNTPIDEMTTNIPTTTPANEPTNAPTTAPTIAPAVAPANEPSAKSVWLTDLYPLSNDDVDIYSNSVMDNIGDTHYNRLFGVSGTQIKYYLRGYYKTLTGVWYLCLRDTETSVSSSCEIYADDELVYTSPSIAGGDIPVEFTISINYCDYFTICFTSGNGEAELGDLKLQ